MMIRPLIRLLSLAYFEVKTKAGYDDIPPLQHNFNDSGRQGMGDPVDMADSIEDLDEEEFAAFLENALTFPNTDDIQGRVLDSEVNTGPEELHKVNDFKSSAPYFSNSKCKAR